MEKAVRSRAAARAWVTRSGTELLSLCESTTTSRVEITVKLTSFKEKVSSLEQKQADVEYCIDLASMEDDIEEAAHYASKSVDFVLVKVQEKLNKLSTKAEDSQSVCSTSSAVDAKLPKLELPSFSGEVQEWTPFWEQFEAVVDLSDLPTVAKFSYLRSLLTGDAQAAIAGLSLTAGNYTVACQLLKERFGRKEKIIFAHVQALLNTSVPSQPNVTALWKVYNNLQSHIRSLESLGITGKQYGVILTPLILSRLPVSLRMEWAREGERREGRPGDGTDAVGTEAVGVDADLEFLMCFLNNELRRRERSQTYSDAAVTGQHDAPSSSAAALHTASAKGPQPPSGCGLCYKERRSHTTAECPTLKALPHKERKDRLFSAMVCLKCLEKSTPANPHDFKSCRSKCAHCKGPHHGVLCMKKSNARTHAAKNKSQNDASEGTSVSHSASESVALASSSPSCHTDVLLQTLRVSATGRSGKRKILVLFDTGSDRTYVSQDLVDRVKPEWIESKILSCASFGAKKPSVAERREVYNLLLQGEGGAISVNATCVPNICAPLSQPSVPTHLLQKIPTSNLVSVPAGQNLKVDILIGMDVYWNLLSSDVCRLTSELVAHRSRLGWMLSGRLPTSGSQPQPQSGGEVAHQLFCKGIEENFWTLDSIGITDSVESADDQVFANFKAEIQDVGGRYSVALPWREGMKDRLKPNRASAQKRLNALDRRLSGDKELAHKYDEFFQVMVDQGMVEQVPEDEIDISGPVYYLPHHPVVKDTSTTTKVRPVFDASAKGYNGLSLNDCMHTGPNFLPDLVSLLLRFRRWKVALTADVVKAFLQVAVHPSDRDAHRFLWGDKVMRFTRVPFGNRASPFLLCATIRHHLSLCPDSRVVAELGENLYMDDWLTGCDSEELVQEMFLEAQTLMRQAGMELAKWTSNSMSFSERESESTKVLGMRWTPTTDAFSFDGLEVPSSLCLTKRIILSLISRLFDPLGLLNPFIIRAKILFQSLWREDYDWDQSLSQEWKDWFGDWLSELDTLKKWSIPRRFFSCLWSDNPTLILHGFGDASPLAYGACVYLEKKGSDGHETSLVMSRARVSPLKSLSLPRLELLGALLCARLMEFVRSSLRLDENVKSVCWTDSTITMAWINGEPHKWKTFVGNRVKEIHKLTKPEQWHHCPGRLNPADLITRGITASELVTSQCWLYGPTELMRDVEENSDSNSKPYTRISGCMSVDENESVEQEMRSHISLVTVGKTEEPVKAVFDIERHSKWTKALRVMAHVLRFVRALKGGQNTGTLSFKELTDAKLSILKVVQAHHYSQELKALESESPLPKNSPIRKLSPFIGDDGLLRVKGRLQFAALPAETRHPILIPKGHLATLLVRHTHLTMHHAGVNSMLVYLRNCYWIISARRICKAEKGKCLNCQRFDAKTCGQQMAPLPEERVNEAPPFSVTGLDHAGPLYCVDFPGKKFYILLFTCAVVRAVHLELVDSLAQTDTTLALRRFCARRGVPTIIWSDNAKGFQATKRHLEESFGDEAPDWKFIAPRAPWWGGFWERMVGTVKASLRKTLGKSRLCRQELETVLHEVEACVNSRPLTFVGDVLADSGRQLTPSHFLLGRSSPQAKVTIPDNSESDIQQLTRLDHKQSELATEFWEVWRDSYLKNLRPSVGDASRGEVGEGSVVLIDSEGPRLDWPLGIVETVHPSRDGLTRTVTLRTAKGRITRPIQRLCHLEISMKDTLPKFPIASPSPRETTATSHKPCTHYLSQTPKHTSTEDKSAHTVTKTEKTTRSGRTVKSRQILDL